MSELEETTVVARERLKEECDGWVERDGDSGRDASGVGFGDLRLVIGALGAAMLGEASGDCIGSRSWILSIIGGNNGVALRTIGSAGLRSMYSSLYFASAGKYTLRSRASSSTIVSMGDAAR